MKKILLVPLVMLFLASVAVAGAGVLALLVSKALIVKLGYQPPKVKKVQEIIDEL